MILIPHPLPCLVQLNNSLAKRFTMVIQIYEDTNVLSCSTLMSDELGPSCILRKCAGVIKILLS